MKNTTTAWSCSVPECARAKSSKAAKGMCGYHYKKTLPRTPKAPRAPRECAADGCIKISRQRLCSTHERLRWLADPNAARCSLEGCVTRALRDGYCETHYQRIVKYGVTPDRFDQILAEQGGGCAICSSPQSELKHALVVDHDHSCCPGKRSCGRCVRGILCRACNVGIGNLRDDPRLVRSALNYLTH